MAQQVGPFLGIIPRTSFSEEHIRRVGAKIEDIKKTSLGVVEYFHLINRGAELYNSATSKQVESLQQFINADMNDDKKYYLLLSTVFKAISLNFTQFGNGLEASLKEYHVVTNVELDELSNDHFEHAMSAFRKYRQRQEQLLDNHKRYIKSQKTFNDSLQSYKLSLSDVKLIYNKEETLRRYQQCQSNYKNIITEEQSIQERSLKCTKDKRDAIYAFNSLSAEFKTAYQFVGEKVVVEAKNIMTLFCSVHKLVMSDIATKKKSLEQTRIGTFLDATPQFLEASRFFKADLKRVPSRNPIFLECYESIKDEYLPCFGRWLNDYQNYLREKSQAYQKILRRVYGFLMEQTRGMEKMSLFLIKDVPQTYDKLKKRLQELIGNKSVDFIRCVNSTLELSMRVYEKLIKALNAKLDIIDKSIQQQTRLGDLFFKELAKQIDPLFKKGMNEETSYETLTEDQRKEHRESVAQKSQIIKHFLSSFGEKFAKNTEVIRAELLFIVNQIFVSFNEIYLYSTEYQETYFGLDFEEGLKRCRSDMDGLIEKEKVVEPVCADMASEEVVLQPAERFKIDEYRAIRKPSSAEDIDVIKEQLTKKVSEQLLLKNSVVRRGTITEYITTAGTDMDPKQKRYFEFLKQKVNMQPDEKLIKTYSCALYDKIILQGKLYVTSGRICFHSYFNAANLFFGSTFLNVPKKDIVKIEKRFNAIIFDNSLAVTTVNGEVFFTSFFKRNEAYKLIRSLYELPGQDDDEEEEDGKSPPNEEEDATTTAEKAPAAEQVAQKAEPQQKEVVGNGSKSEAPITSKAPSVPDQKPEQKVDKGISASQQLERLHSFREVESKKYKKIFTGEIENTSCLFILRHFIIDNETSVGLKKYPSFSQLYKETSIGSKDIRYEKWVPCITQFISEDSIKPNTPMHFKRKVASSHPMPKTSIPFMPKFCESNEQLTLHLISKDKFLFDTLVKNKGAPYTDSFQLHTRTKYENTPAGNVEITWYMELEFLKSVMVKSMIESQTTKEFTEATMKFFKFLTDKVKVEQVKQHKLQQKRQHIKKENSMIEVTVNGQPSSQSVEVEKPKTFQPSPIKAIQQAATEPEPAPTTTNESEPTPQLQSTHIEALTLQNKILKVLLAISLLLNLIMWIA